MKRTLVNVKQLSRTVSEVHNSNSFSLTMFEGDSAIQIARQTGLVVMNCTDDDEAQRYPAQRVSPKAVRDALFRLRNHEGMMSETGLIWTFFDKEKGVSYVGLGSLVTPEEAKRVEAEGKYRRIKV